MSNHVSPLDAGVTALHVTAIEETVKEFNAFLFLRPTEDDSRVLIEAGFATKSMDIHDKSSNWGPMAGMVPCDPYFSKKKIGAPNPHPHYHQHGAAEPVHLKLDGKLENELCARGKMSRYLGNYRITSSTITIAGGAVPGARFYKADKMVFCVNDTGVYWVQFADLHKTGGTLIPVYVWAYRVGGVLKPVTGDYDMWMVVSHASAWWKHMESIGMEDEHGNSTASKFTKQLVDAMNAACKRQAPLTNQVFNHGAEAQNYAFTQSLDARLAMFTPAGTSRMVSIWDMPKIIADLQNMGYLAIYNKRYHELDARLMGKSTIPAVAALEAAQKSREADVFKRHGASMIGGIGWKAVTLLRFREALKELKALKAGAAPGASASPTAPTAPATSAASTMRAARPGAPLARAHWKLVRTAVRNGLEPSRIARLGDELMAMLGELDKPLQFLTPEDFPPALRKLGALAQQLLTGIQRSAVEATTGAGETDADKIWEWARKNEMTLDQFNLALGDLQKATAPI